MTSAPGSSSQFLTSAEACSYLRITPNHLAELVRAGRLHAYRSPVGDHLVFARGDLDGLLEEVPAEDAALRITQSKDFTMFDAPVATMAAPTASTLDARGDLAADIKTFFNEQRRLLTHRPLWLDIDDAEALFGASARTIKQWAADGFVRKSKLGPTFQSKAVYNADDLNDVLCRIAAGRPPVVALRRET